MVMGPNTKSPRHHCCSYLILDFSWHAIGWAPVEVSRRHVARVWCCCPVQCSVPPSVHFGSASALLSLQLLKTLSSRALPPPCSRGGVLPLARQCGQSPPARDADVSLLVLRSDGVIFSTLGGLGGIQFCCWLDSLMDILNIYRSWTSRRHPWACEKCWWMSGRAPLVNGVLLSVLVPSSAFLASFLGFCMTPFFSATLSCPSLPPF